MGAKPYLVTSGATRGVDLLELVGKQYATDPNLALQWVGADSENAAKFEVTGWQRVKEGGIDVVVMGQLLMSKDRYVVDAERQRVADQGEKNFADAVARADGITVKTTWVKDPTK